MITNSSAIVSLFGKELPINHSGNGEWLARLSFARAAFEGAATEENTIALGRVLAAGQRVREAIQVFTKGLEQNASSVALYRFRGHRYISARQFDLAIADFERALQLAQMVPAEHLTPDLMFNIWYHLGLAHFLKADFEKAAAAYGECLQWCQTDEDLVACLDWYHMALRRDGQHEAAHKLLERIDDTMDAGESRPYLQRLLVYKGELSGHDVVAAADGDEMEFATHAFGIANELLVDGEIEEAIRLLDRILSGSTAWMSFAYIAAEADLYRQGLV